MVVGLVSISLYRQHLARVAAFEELQRESRNISDFADRIDDDLKSIAEHSNKADAASKARVSASNADLTTVLKRAKEEQTNVSALQVDIRDLSADGEKLADAYDSILGSRATRSFRADFRASIEARENSADDWRSAIDDIVQGLNGGSGLYAAALGNAADAKYRDSDREQNAAQHKWEDTETDDRELQSALKTTLALAKP